MDTTQAVQATSPAAGALMSASDLIRATFQTYKSHLGMYFGFGAWLFIPAVLIILGSLLAGSSDGAAVADGIASFSTLLYVILTLWVTAVTILATNNLGAGAQARGLGSAAWGLVPSLILIMILQTFITIFGYILLIIPGIIFSIWFSFSGVVQAVEKPGVVASLKRSRALVRGRWWGVFGRGLLFGLVTGIAYIAITFAVLLVTGGLSSIGGSVIGPIAELLIRLVDVLFIPFYAVFMTLFYRDLVKSPSAPAKAAA